MENKEILEGLKGLVDELKELLEEKPEEVKDEVLGTVTVKVENGEVKVETDLDKKVPTYIFSFDSKLSYCGCLLNGKPHALLANLTSATVRIFDTIEKSFGKDAAHKLFEKHIEIVR